MANYIKKTKVHILLPLLRTRCNMIQPDRSYLCTGPDILHSPRTYSHRPLQCQHRPPPPPPPPPAAPPADLPEDSPEPGYSGDTQAGSRCRIHQSLEESRSRELAHPEEVQHTELGSLLRADTSTGTLNCSDRTLQTCKHFSKHF